MTPTDAQYRAALVEIGHVLARDATENGCPPVYAQCIAIIGEALAGVQKVTPLTAAAEVSKPVSDDAHFLMSLSVDLTNRGEKYFGQRCGEIASSITAAAEDEALHLRAQKRFRELGWRDRDIEQAKVDTIERCAQRAHDWLEHHGYPAEAIECAAAIGALKDQK